MSNSVSILEDLLNAIPDLHPQIYFKPSLTALSHAMEDQVLAGRDRPLVIANFQQERFYRQEAARYLKISQRTDQVYVLAAPETDFKHQSHHYETIAFDPTDALCHEWHLVVLGPDYASCLICRERPGASTDLESQADDNELSTLTGFDQSRRFEGIWTFDRTVVCTATALLLERILQYRPELQAKVALAQRTIVASSTAGFNTVDPGPFAERLVTYLQAGQYKLLKAYRSIAAQEQKERLVNSITSAIRRSLDPDAILSVAVKELGTALHVCRCLIYRCKESDQSVQIQHEHRTNDVPSVLGQSWPVAHNPLFQAVVEHKERIYVEDARAAVWMLQGQAVSAPVEHVQDWQIGSWLMVPVVHQNRLLGMVEAHHCGLPCSWSPDNLELIEAIAVQIGVALIQAEAYAHLEEFNQQLEALDRTRSNLIAITGHELRTPLSTIQVCLESLASEPDMPAELQHIMLQSALTDAERMRKLIQDFLTLSQLESGRVVWHLEPLPMQECVDLALSSLRTRQLETPLPAITTQIPTELPLVKADGEWVVEVLTKLLDNACKFTEPHGTVTIEVHPNGGQMLEVTVADTGRGIEPNRLEVVFDRFYQEEGALRRSAGGTGLGLAICRQIVSGMGGQIWAESGGKDQGSQFHLTLPLVQGNESEPMPPEPNARSPKSNPKSNPKSSRSTQQNRQKR